VIRVAVVIEALGRGGAERLIVDTARRLDPTRFALHVYTVYPVRRDYEADLRSVGVPETCMGLSGLSQAPIGALRLSAMLKREPPDVVHTHLFGANLVGRWAARLVRCPVVSTYHDADYEPVVRNGNPSLTPFKQRLLQLIDAATVVATRPRLVAVSEHVARSVRQRIRADDVHVIPNAVDTTVFRPDTERRKVVRVQLGVSTSTRVVACVGRMTAQKGQSTLIHAMAQIATAIDDCRLLLVGDGPDNSELRRLADRLGIENRVSFLGIRSDVPDLLRAVDVVAVPSLHEGFGLVLIEALATGVPVVASNTGPVPEIVNDGVTGRLVPAADAPRLARAITELLTDDQLRLAMSQRARFEAERRFDIATMLTALERLYSDMAQRQDG
jgi:glycosyltransferase involved in cell wall biosynthesis